MHALDGFIKDFIYGIFVKAGIQLAFSLFKGKEGIFTQIKNLANIDTLMFGVFTGSFMATFRLILCKLRALRNKEDKYNSMIAGFLASFTLMIDRSKRRRITVGIYSFTRSFEVMIKILDTNDVIKESK